MNDEIHGNCKNALIDNENYWGAGLGVKDVKFSVHFE